MAGKPIVTVGSMHVCPMCSGTVPHIGGPVIGPGSPNVLINGKPASLMGDLCTCAGGPDTIVEGVPTVLINGMPAVTLGCMTAHGGSVVQGEPTVIIGSGVTQQTKVMPLKKIPFPKIRTVDRLVSPLMDKRTSVKEAEQNQKEIKKRAVAENMVPEPRIVRVEFFDDESNSRIDKARQKEVVKVRALTSDFPDGEVITFHLNRKDIFDFYGNAMDNEDEMVTLTATVSNDEAIAEYKIKNYDEEEEGHE